MTITNTETCWIETMTITNTETYWIQTMTIRNTQTEEKVVTVTTNGRIQACNGIYSMPRRITVRKNNTLLEMTKGNPKEEPERDTDEQTPGPTRRREDIAHRTDQ
jgi:hypothetical protein